MSKLYVFLRYGDEISTSRHSCHSDVMPCLDEDDDSVGYAFKVSKSDSGYRIPMMIPSASSPHAPSATRFASTVIRKCGLGLTDGC